MAGVAVAALVCAAIRSDASPDFGIALIASSVILLACAHYSELLVLRRLRGTKTSPRRKAALLTGSLVIAVVFVGLSDLAFLIGYEFYRGYLARGETDWRWDLSPGCTIAGAILGTILAVGVASVLRVAIWPCEQGASSRSSWNWRSKARLVAVLLALVIFFAFVIGGSRWRAYWLREADPLHPIRFGCIGGLSNQPVVPGC